MIIIPIFIFKDTDFEVEIPDSKEWLTYLAIYVIMLPMVIGVMSILGHGHMLILSAIMDMFVTLIVRLLIILFE